MVDGLSKEFQLVVMKKFRWRTTLILFLALVLVAGASCHWDDKFVVKSLPVGDDRSIIVVADSSYEISRTIYYQVKIGEKVVVSTCRICQAAKDPDSLNFKILSASSGNLIALYEETNPERILALHEFNKGMSWPRGAHDEWSEEIDKRGERLLQQLRQEYPNSNLRLSGMAACGIKLPTDRLQ